MSPVSLPKGSSIFLDVLRGFSAQAVVIGHGISFFGIASFLHEPNFPWIQNMAVVVFFILSGFLISFSIFKNIETRIDYSYTSYLIDRFSRIYTAYVPALLFVVVIDSVSIALAPENYKYTSAFTFSSFLGNLFLLQDFPFMKSLNILAFTSFGSARTFWTLAIEWWIYLWFGYIVFVYMKKKSISIFSQLLLFVLSIAPLYHLLSGRGNGLTAFWLMGAGVWILSKTFPMATFTKMGKLLLIVLLVCFALGRAYIKMTAYDPIFALLLACILFLSIDIVKDMRFHPKVEQLIRLNANYSFTLYLIHYSILDFIVTHWGNVYSPYLLFFIGCVMSNVISFMMGYVFEVTLTPVVKKYLYKKFLSY